MAKYLLLTGATGLVGRYLLRDLLLDGHRVAVAVRPTKSETPVERIEAIVQFWEEQLDTTLPRPVVLAGDVTAPNFGLGYAELEWIEQFCDRILHNAAVLTFHGPDRSGEPWHTNLEGTRNTLDLCERLGISEFHYVSTAYVCGTRDDLVCEDELDVGQSFRNDYEHSKFLAEQVVRSASFLSDLTVYRPTVIAGDSRTGYTSTYHGLYMYLKLMAVICGNVAPGPDGVKYTPIQLQMTGDEPRNIVPVDWVSTVIARVFKTAELHGRTYHLSPSEPVTPRQTIEAGYSYFNSRGVEFVGPVDQSLAPVSTLDQAAKDSMTMYESYETTDPLFDTTNLSRYLPDLPCPRIDEAMLHRFWRFGEQDRWGKRRWPKPVIPFQVQEYLNNQLGRSENKGLLQPSAGRTVLGLDVLGLDVLGLDVHGPGGGQWNMEFSGERLVSVAPGLPSDSCLVVSISSCDFSRIAEKHESLTRGMLLRLAANHSRERTELHSLLATGFAESAEHDWLNQPDPDSNGITATARLVDGK